SVLDIGGFRQRLSTPDGRARALRYPEGVGQRSRGSRTRAPPESDRDTISPTPQGLHSSPSRLVGPLRGSCASGHVPVPGAALRWGGAPHPGGKKGPPPPRGGRRTTGGGKNKKKKTPPPPRPPAEKKSVVFLPPSAASPPLSVV